MVPDWLTAITDSTKINRPGHSIHMYWTNFWQPTVHVKQTIFEKTLIEVCRTYLYASVGTFCVQIGQLFAAHRVFKQSEEFRNRRDFPSKAAILPFSYISQRLTVPWIVNQFGRKRCQKKHKVVSYQLLKLFFKIIWCERMVGCQNFVQYILMEQGRFMHLRGIIYLEDILQGGVNRKQEVLEIKAFKFRYLTCL